jgi:hypothetical protein
MFVNASLRQRLYQLTGARADSTVMNTLQDHGMVSDNAVNLDDCHVKDLLAAHKHIQRHPAILLRGY